MSPMIINYVPILIVVLAIPLLFDRVPRNRWYGFRTAASLSSDQAWYQSNRVAAKGMCVAAAIWMVAALVLSQVMSDQNQATMIALVVGTVCVIGAAIVAQIIVNRPSHG